MPRKIVINTNHTWFFLSAELKAEYAKRRPSVKLDKKWSIYSVARDDPLLIELIENFGLRRAGRVPSKLKIVAIPDDVVDWEIVDDDGKECVVEKKPRVWE